MSVAVTQEGNSGSNGPTSPDPMKPLPSKPWWHRHCEPEDRRRVMTDLAIRRVEHWAFRFTLMLTLSVVVATMGLSLNSAAVVIGAMLLAPLMQPVLATGASLSMALPGKSIRSITRVILASVWCVAVAWLISKILPRQPFTDEVLSRTRPDIRDLIVALAAGTAGAYATVRNDVSASLPGVAVAVALVPPLGALGITIEAGDTARAQGAALLYTTNLAAIVFASIVVFVVTGFVPPRRLANKLSGLVLAAVTLAAAVAVVAYPLYQASQASIEATEDLDYAEERVDVWLGDRNLERSVRITGSTIVVDVRGFDAPPDQSTLEADLATRFPDSDVLVEWIRLERATTTTTAPPTPDERLLSEVRTEVVAWLDESGIDYRLDTVSIADSTVRIDAAGSGDPPSLTELGDRLAAINPSFTPRMNWTQRETIRPGDGVVTPLELTTQSMRNEVELWGATRGWIVRDLVYDGERLMVEIAGPREPTTADVRRLEGALDELDAPYELDLYFVQRSFVTTTTAPEPTTTAPEPTTTAPEPTTTTE